MRVRPPLNRAVFFAAVALVLAACRDANAPIDRRTVVPGDRNATISDGAHTNGNDDVWFLPPMVANPQGAPGYGDAFQPGLPVVYVIRDMTNNGAVIRSLNAQVNGEAYAADWDTKNDHLVSSHTYRIEVTIAQKVLAFADVSKDADDMKNNGTQQIVKLNGNGALPIRVRVEKGWNCVNNNSCVSQTVPASIPTGQKVIVTSPDGNNMAAFSGNWFDPNQAGTSNVVVTIEDVTSQYTPQPNGCSLGLTKENSQGMFGLSTEFCVRISIEPHVVLTQPVVVGLCRQNPGDERQMMLKYDINETPKFLAEAQPPAPCPLNIGAVTHEQNPLKRLAAAVFSGAGSAVNWALGVKPAYAIHLGVGGLVEIGDDFSVFTLGLPATMVPVAGPAPLGLAGSALPIKPKVRVLAVHDTGGAGHPAGVTNAGVTCQVTSGTGGGLLVGNAVLASAPATELPSNDGTYECPTWVLSSTVGVNTLKVTSARLDATMIANLDGNIVTLPGELGFGVNGAAINSVTVLPASLSLNVGQSAQLTANVSQSGGAPINVMWSSSNPAVANVNPAGLVTVVAPGNATITATSLFDPSKSASVPVTGSAAPSVLSVSVLPPSASLSVGQTVQLNTNVVVTNGAPQTVTWSSSNTAVATVSASGLVTAISAGPATITATSTFDPTKSGASAITVNLGAVLSVSLTPPGVVMPITTTSFTFTPTVTVTGGAPQTVSWSTVNPSIATVNQSGVVTPVAIGPTIVKATSTFDPGKFGTATIDVVAVQPDFYNLSLSTSTLTIGGAAGNYVAKISNGTGATYPGQIDIQAWIDQGNATRAANGSVISCGFGLGVLPFGICTTSFSYSASNSGAGTGTLVPGAATLRFELRQFLNNQTTVIATKLVPITLQ